MPAEDLLDSICAELVREHGVHTILLYGSHADGSAGPESDWDVAAFATATAQVRIARQEQGQFLDLFVYPETVLAHPAAEHLKLRGARVLMQRGDGVQVFFEKLEEMHRAGPPVVAADEIEAIKVWAHKMLARMRRGDPEGDYRRSWLLYALLEDYFAVRGLWYEGPKKALKWLARSDAASYDAFRLALRPGASENAIATLVHRVAGSLHPQ